MGMASAGLVVWTHRRRIPTGYRTVRQVYPDRSDGAAVLGTALRYGGLKTERGVSASVRVACRGVGDM